VKRVLALLDEPPPEGHSQWNGSLLAEALTDVSTDQVWRILRRHSIRLQRRRSWCITTDPEFGPKAADVVGMYLSPPDNAVVLCVDEKPHIQALQRAQGYLRLPDGKAVNGFSHCDKRHGTTTLFAALDVATGQVKTGHYARRRRREFLDFMNEIVAENPGREIHVILDNLNTHKPKRDRWLKLHPEVHLHFIPTYSSWLNQVECWFSILSRSALRGASFTSARELRQRVLEELQRRNLSPPHDSRLYPYHSRFAVYFHKPPDQLGVEEVRQFQLHMLRDQKLATGTVQNRMTALHFFFKRVLKRHDPELYDMALTRRPKKLPVVLSAEEVEKLIEAAPNIRYRMILVLLYSTGLRRTEASQLKIADIDSKRMVIHVHEGKNSRDRELPLTPKLLAELRDYWRACKVKPRVYLFPTRFKTVDEEERPITDKAVWHACRESARRADLGSRNALGRIPSATLSPPTSWRAGPIYRPFSSSWGTKNCRTLLSTCTSRGAICTPPSIRWSASRSAARKKSRPHRRAAAVARPRFELADVVRKADARISSRHREGLTWPQVKVLNAILRCRTAALGGHRDQCTRCGYQTISYNSCRNRHCPKCQTNAREKWLAAPTRTAAG
jgi:integrase